MATRISTELDTLISSALESFGAGEAIDWDLALVIHPEQGPIYYLSLLMSSPMVGEKIAVGRFFPMSIRRDAKSINMLIEDSVESLRSARTEVIANSLKGTSDTTLYRPAGSSS